MNRVQEKSSARKVLGIKEETGEGMSWMWPWN